MTEKGIIKKMQGKCILNFEVFQFNRVNSHLNHIVTNHIKRQLICQ